MKHFIICSLKNLNENYHYIVTLRDYLKSKNQEIVDDWTSNSLLINNTTDSIEFMYNTQKDYLKEALEDIKNTDFTHFFFTNPSTYLSTLCRY